MSKVLSKTEFGNPILREQTKKVSIDEINSAKVQSLIKNMYYTLNNKPYGVGIAATQVGENIAISVIDTKPTPTRPNLKREKLTIINPEIIETYGKQNELWEACISGPEMYAKVPRYKRIKLTWFDENGHLKENIFDGFIAHVIQHEVDHLNGVLFVDRVKDTKTYTTLKEYKKIIKSESKENS
jgi:peptide deformylase